MILNIYSILLLLVYFGLVLLMSVFFSWNSMQNGFYNTFPIIIILVTWSQLMTPHIEKKESELSRKDRFKRDFFLVFILFFSTSILELYLGYSSIDTLDWWPVAFCLMLVTSLFFSLIFALISLCTQLSKGYVLYFSLCLNLFMLFLQTASYWSHLSLFSSAANPYLALGVFLLIHLIFCLYQRRYKR